MHFLDEKGADIDAKNSFGSTALPDTAERKYKEIMQLLVEKEADITAKNDDGMTFLHELNIIIQRLCS